MNEAVVCRTFSVSQVRPATTMLPEIEYPQAVARFIGSPVESCSQYHGKLVANVLSHPLIAALHGAFCEHRRVCLSPDIIWLTITQGLATHINQNAETLRRHFVTHDGQMTLKMQRDDFIKGCPENPWAEVFSEFSRQIHAHAGPAYDLVVANFSTTGPVERAASEVVLLDSMQSYFRYELFTRCGIPSITLEGTEEDWRLMAARVEEFSALGLDWWIDRLRPILHQFASAAAGKAERSFWKSIYKHQGPEGSGSAHISGWVVDLFPYMSGQHGTMQRNPWLGVRSSRQGPTREDFPNTMSKAPLKWTYMEKTFDMEFFGGLLGVAQDSETLALKPQIGWAVCEAGAPCPPNQYQPRPQDWGRGPSL